MLANYYFPAGPGKNSPADARSHHHPGPTATCSLAWGAKLGLLLLAAFATSLEASPIITYQVASLGIVNGQAAFRYTYSFSGLDLLANQELDIQFSSDTFGSLFNGKAGSDFDLLLFEPNSPPGADGDYSALALVDHPSFAGTFSVDFTYLPAGTPGAQSFLLFDDSGPVSVALGSGLTSSEAAAHSPEPASFWQAALGSLTLLSGFLLRQRLKQ